MERSRILFCLLLGLILASCTRDEIGSANPDAAFSNGCPPVRLNSNLPADPITVNGLAINGNCLDVGIQFSGGCENHRWDLTWDGSYLESLPVQVNLYLLHDANGDMCKALIGTTLSRNLQPIEDPNYSSIVVNVVDPAGNVSSILYNY